MLLRSTQARQVFKPELLNRFDDIIVFRQLERADVSKILDIELKRVTDRLSAAKGISVELDESARDFLLDKGFDQAFGARPLRRAIENLLEDPLSDDLLRGRFDPPCTVRATVADGADRLAFESVSKEIPPEDPATATIAR